MQGGRGEGVGEGGEGGEGGQGEGGEGGERRRETVCTHRCMHMWRSEANTGSLPLTLSTVFLCQGLSVNLELSDPAKLDGQSAPQILLFLLSQSWDYRYVPPCPAFNLGLCI